MKWITKRVKYKDLVPADYNPRQLTEKQKEDLQKSIDKFGIVEIPVANLDNTLLAGHQRVMIKLLEDPEYEDDVRYPERQLTEKEAKEYNIRSNKNTGSWDWDLLANNFENDDLIEWGFEDWEVGGGDLTLTDDDLINEDLKKEIEDKRNAPKICPHCGKEC